MARRGRRRKGITIPKIRGFGYKFLKYLGDFNSIIQGKIGRRVLNRVLGKFTGRGLRAVTKGVKCFVATAVYQNPEAKEVQILRDYRDDVLANSRIGRAAIDLYYSGLGERVAYLLERDWQQTIPTIKRGLDYLVERIEKRN